MFIALLFFFGPAHDSFAESAINCHCFQDRTYNPADKFAADDYILATSFNSLLAKSFSMPKRRIVMLKMKEGVGQDDLLVGLKIANVTGIDLQKLLTLRRDKKFTWSTIISDLADKEHFNKDRLVEAIRSGLSVDEAGAGVADELIADFFKVPAETIQRFRTTGLNEKEMAVLFILAHAGDRKPEALVDLRTKEGKSWSEIANGFNIEPVAAGKLIIQYPAKQIPR